MRPPPKYVVPHVIDFDPQLREAFLTVESHLATLESQAGSGGDGTTILTGTGPPASSLGDDGDFYIDTATDIMYGPKQSASFGASSSAFPSLTPASSTTGAYTTCNEFAFPVGGRIVAVRHYRDATSAVTSRKVFVWTKAGALLASATSSGEAGGGWWQTPLPTPLAVTAGDHLIVGYSNSAADTLRYSTGVVTSTSPNISFVAGIYADGVDNFPAQPFGGTYAADVAFQAASSTVWPIALEGGGGGGGGSEEVFIGPTDPGTGYELWYDTDAPGVPGNLIPVFANVAAMKADTTNLVCAVQIGATYHAMCSRLNTSSAWVGSFDSSVTRTTDAGGVLILTPADMQMTTLLSAQVTSNWTASLPGISFAGSRIVSGNLQVKVWQANAAGAITALPSTACLVYYHIYGIF